MQTPGLSVRIQHPGSLETLCALTGTCGLGPRSCWGPSLLLSPCPFRACGLTAKRAGPGGAGAAGGGLLRSEPVLCRMPGREGVREPQNMQRRGQLRTAFLLRPHHLDLQGWVRDTQVGVVGREGRLVLKGTGTIGHKQQNSELLGPRARGP